MKLVGRYEKSGHLLAMKQKGVWQMKNKERTKKVRYFNMRGKGSFFNS